jgi:hypothetical protein
MRSRPSPGKPNRPRAEEQLKTTKKIDSEFVSNALLRQAEAEKTSRLRELRLAREAADKGTANPNAAAAKARGSVLRRRVAGPQISGPSEPK